MSNQAKRLSSCPAERLAQCRGGDFAPAGDGVDFGIDGRSVRVSQEAYSIFLAREQMGKDRVAALQQRLNIADQRVCDLTWLAKSAYMEGWELGWVTRHTDANNEKRVTPWAPPREVMEREWLTSEGRAALNTNAPAAKVDCGNCAFVADVCLTECESKKIRDAQVKP